MSERFQAYEWVVGVVGPVVQCVTQDGLSIVEYVKCQIWRWISKNTWKYVQCLGISCFDFLVRKTLGTGNSKFGNANLYGLVKSKINECETYFFNRHQNLQLLDFKNTGQFVIYFFPWGHLGQKKSSVALKYFTISVLKSFPLKIKESPKTFIFSLVGTAQ